MKFIGQVYQLKESLEEIKSELTPSFDEVIRSYLGRHVRTKFKDPTYVIEATWLTPSLKAFLTGIFEALKIPSVQGTFLIRGFGFGKTHAMILLWHLLNSNEGLRSQMAHSLSLEGDIVKETLVLGVDFSKDGPFAQIFDQLEALAQGRLGEWNVKDPRLYQAATEAMKEVSRSKIASMTSADLANLIIKVLEGYRRLGGRPRFLLLVDELGIGVITRLMRYIEAQSEEQYLEIDKMINFIEELYTKLTGKGIPVFIIIALAEQDLREIDSIYLQQVDKPIIQSKIDGLKKRLSILSERLSRAVGGLSGEKELSYDPEQAINIARHRVLKRLEDVKPEEELLSYLTLQAHQFNLQEILDAYKEQIKAYYPLSPSMVWLFRKILNPIDAPRTEYVRTALYMFAEAAEHALKQEPDKALSIGTKHISLARASAVDLMAEFETEWASALSDIEHALKSIGPEIQETASMIAKQILAKGATANVTALLEVRDLKDLKSYGVTIEEMLLDILSVLEPEKAVKTIGQVQEALEALKTQSARVEEKELGKQKFYMPSLMRTVYDKLATFVLDQKKVLEERAQLPIYLQRVGLPSLFYHPKATITREDEVTILLKEYSKLENVEELLTDKDFRASQNEGKLSIIVVPPWDMFLFNELYLRRADYRTLTNTIAQKLQEANLEGKILYPLHIIILLPNVSPEKVAKLIDDVISYAAIKDFLEYLKNKERILEDKLIDYERTIQKRLTLRLKEFIDEQRKKLELGLKNSIERQIRDARTSAQRELIKLTRRIATSVLELYEEVIFYNMQTQSFTPQSLLKLFDELSKEAEKLERDQKPSFSDYSLIINTFFGRVVESTGFVWNPKIIAEALCKHYKAEFEVGAVRAEDRIEEVARNAMQGTYYVKPLSLQVAKEAISQLNGEVLEVEGKKIKLVVDEVRGYIKFEVEEVRPSKELEAPTEVITPSLAPEVSPALTTTTLERAIDRVVIEVDEKFDYEGFKSRLETLYKTYGTLISSIELSVNSNSLRAILHFLGSEHKLSNIIAATRFLRYISNEYKSTPYVEVRFRNLLPQDKVQEILGPFFTTKVRRSWDRVLPG